MLSVTSDDEWRALRSVLGDPDWITAEMDGVEGRRAAHDLLDEKLAEWTAGQSPAEAANALQAAGIAAAPVLHELEALAEPHFRERGLFGLNGSADTGSHEHATHVFRWDGPDLRFEELPVLGGHNEDVFRGLLGLDDDEWQALVDDGHIHTSYLAPDGTPI